MIRGQGFLNHDKNLNTDYSSQVVWDYVRNHWDNSLPDHQRVHYSTLLNVTCPVTCYQSALNVLTYLFLPSGVPLSSHCVLCLIPWVLIRFFYVEFLFAVTPSGI